MTAIDLDSILVYKNRSGLHAFSLDGETVSLPTGRTVALDALADHAWEELDGEPEELAQLLDDGARARMLVLVQHQMDVERREAERAQARRDERAARLAKAEADRAYWASPEGRAEQARAWNAWERDLLRLLRALGGR